VKREQRRDTLEAGMCIDFERWNGSLDLGRRGFNFILSLTDHFKSLIRLELFELLTVDLPLTYL
jgi:hypothetical protein